jgi:UDP-N-acetyl-D-glucosamine/UDP-N-acetyl-D-galactosamine dehydrogenase
VLGLTFKEDCPDIRNSKVVDIVRELEGYGISVRVHDPFAKPELAHEVYGLKLFTMDKLAPADALIVAVAHREFRRLGLDTIRALVKPGHLVLDVKGILDRSSIETNGFRFWRL